MEAVEVACETALEVGTASESVILNYLTRLTEERTEQSVSIPDKLRLKEEPRADCGLYDSLLESGHVA
jgi:hypothetical protein